MYCPECGGEMGMREVKCPHCGYDFPSVTSNERRPILFAYSSFAYVVLALAIVGLSVACLGFVAYAVVMVFSSHRMYSHDWLDWTVRFFATLVALVVVLRVFDIRPRGD
jgi:hypothetical protein